MAAIFIHQRSSSHPQSIAAMGRSYMRGCETIAAMGRSYNVVELRS